MVHVRRVGWGIAAFLALAAGGCATNRYVNASTLHPGMATFYYNEGGDFGAIRCARGPQGELSQCRQIPVVLEGE